MYGEYVDVVPEYLMHLFFLTGFIQKMMPLAVCMSGSKAFVSNRKKSDI